MEKQTETRSPTCSPGSSQPENRLETQRKVKLLGRLWVHYPSQDMTPAAWQAVTEDYLKHISHCPASVLEKAIERGQREWNFRPSIAQLLDAVNGIFRDQPKSPQPEDWKRQTLGGYTAWRRAELSKGWLSAHRSLVEMVRDNGHISALTRALEDGANIIAQIEWHQRTEPHWKPQRAHQVNVSYDPIRGWQIDPHHEAMARWQRRAA